MKTSKFIWAVALVMSSFGSFAQGSGKVTLKAEIESENEKRNLQISVIDLSTKELVQRDVVSNVYFCILPLNHKYMIHFKKEGHPTSRLILNTEAPGDVSYFIHMALKLQNFESETETGISQATGTLAFNSETQNFEHSRTSVSAGSMVTLKYTHKVDEIPSY